MARLRARLNELYNGDSEAARRFRYGLLVFDLLAISFFVATSFLPLTPAIHAVDLVLGAIFLIEYVARLFITTPKLRFVFRLSSLADLIVIVSLLAPAVTENYAFLRVLRSIRLLRSYRVLSELRSRYRFFARHEEVLQSITNLVVFIFIVTALVYVFQADVNPNIQNYVDALYFTVTTLTTTGFGDIIMVGSAGRLLAVLIMIFGISLFVRLAQTVFRPAKVRYVCPKCGLSRHDPDAVHCKHCGQLIHIETEGA